MRRGSSVVGEEAATRGAGVTSLAVGVSGQGAGAAPRGGRCTTMLTNPLDEVLITGSPGELASFGSTVSGRIWT